MEMEQLDSLKQKQKKIASALICDYIKKLSQNGLEI